MIKQEMLNKLGRMMYNPTWYVDSISVSQLEWFVSDESVSSIVVKVQNQDPTGHYQRDRVILVKEYDEEQVPTGNCFLTCNNKLSRDPEFVDTKVNIADIVEVLGKNNAVAFGCGVSIDNYQQIHTEVLKFLEIEGVNFSPLSFGLMEEFLEDWTLASVVLTIEQKNEDIKKVILVKDYSTHASPLGYFYKTINNVVVDDRERDYGKTFEMSDFEKIINGETVQGLIDAENERKAKWKEERETRKQEGWLATESVFFSNLDSNFGFKSKYNKPGEIDRSDFLTFVSNKK